MLNRRYLFVIMLALLVTQFCAAQGVRQYVIKGIEFEKGFPLSIATEKMHFSEKGEYGFRYLGSEENLPTNSVSAIHSDSNGLLWIGGASNGVYSYNGESITDFSHIPPFSDKAINCFATGADGDLWVGTRGHGLVKYDGNRFVEYSDKNGLPGERLKVLCLHFDQKGRLWAGTQKQGIFCFENGIFTHYPSLFGPYGYTINSIAESPDGAIWFGAWTGIISIFNEGEWSYIGWEQGVLNSPIWSIIPLGGEMFVTQRNGVFMSNGADVNYLDETDGFCSTDAFKAVKSHTDEIWMVTLEQQLLKWNQKEVVCFEAKEGLTPTRLFAITEDNQGQIWCSSYQDGVIQLTGEHFSNEELIYQGETFKPQGIQISGQDFWVGSVQGKLFKRRLNETEFELIKDFHEEIKEVEVDEDGQVLIGTIRGAYRLNGDALDTLISHAPNSVYTLDFGTAPPQLGELALATSTGLWVLSNGERKRYTSKDGFSSNHVNEFVTDKDGYFWCATNDGIACLKPNTTRFKMLNIENGLPGAVINDLLMTNDEIWFSVKGSGVVVAAISDLQNFIDEEETRFEAFDLISVQNGLASNQPGHLISMSNGDVWIGTTKGIDVFDVETKERIWNFNTSSGLREKVVEYQDPEVLPDGTCIWLIDNKIVHYHPEKDYRRLNKPNVFISGVKLFNEDVNWKKDERFHSKQNYWSSLGPDYMHFERNADHSALPLDLELSYDQNHLTFQFGGIDWIDRQNLSFKFLLEGNDKEWNTIMEAREITYQNLTPGAYKFRIVSEGTDTVSSDEVQFRFTILAPFWQTAWFYLLCALFVLISFIVVFRWRTYRLRKENIILEQKVETRTKDLRLEQEKSENLLLNILPKKTASELKEKGKAETLTHPNASVLFSDFKGFTKLTETMNPQELVIVLDSYFRAYDQALSRYGVEKIKTIGDAYMCACGLPQSAKHHALQTVAFGLEMMRLTNEINAQRSKRGEEPWELRIGIHSGMVIAGVVGQKKFAYDIWGDTVNVASRMESSGQEGYVNISEHTYKLVKSHFVCSSRGKVSAKNKGELQMYFVEGFQPFFADSNNQQKPSAAFFSVIYGAALNVLK
ncbi:MAG: class 3 adenylate cyclase/ligand-binding sensor domain-containing protein [Flavobacteriales bacterium]